MAGALFGSVRQRFRTAACLKPGIARAYGPFAGLDGYLGIRFYIGSDLHYGWIRLNLNNGYPAQAIGFITEWAYNSVPNAPLAAGVVPEPSTLALVALGAACIWKFRTTAPPSAGRG